MGVDGSIESLTGSFSGPLKHLSGNGSANDKSLAALSIVLMVNEGTLPDDIETSNAIHDALYAAMREDEGVQVRLWNPKWATQTRILDDVSTFDCRLMHCWRSRGSRSLLRYFPGQRHTSRSDTSRHSLQTNVTIASLLVPWQLFVGMGDWTRMRIDLSSRHCLMKTFLNTLCLWDSVPLICLYSWLVWTVWLLLWQIR